MTTLSLTTSASTSFGMMNGDRRVTGRGVRQRTSPTRMTWCSYIMLRIFVDVVTSYDLSASYLQTCCKNAQFEPQGRGVGMGVVYGFVTLSA